jgi:hypothetical protein
MWAFVTAALAGNLYVNNVLVDPRSIANVTFEKVTVRVDPQGNLWVDAPGYRIEVQNPVPATAPTVGVMLQSTTRGATGPGPAAGAVTAARWWLVTEDAGTTGHNVQVFVNGQLAYTFVSGQAQTIVDIAKWLVVGPNRIKVVSNSVNPSGGSFYVYMGTGSNQSGTVVLDNPIVQFGVGANRSGPYEREFTMTVDR